MNLKELRLRKMLTQKALADAMKTTQQTVARWESGKTVLNAEQIKELCTVLNCTAKQLLGDMRKQSDVGRAAHLFPVPGAPYGTLKVSLMKGSKEYPIDNATRDDLLVQLSEMYSERADQSDVLWLGIWTLDNRYLIINPRHVRKVELISDDVEAMPGYETDDVYLALTGWPALSADSRTAEACKTLIDELGLEAVQTSVLEYCVTYDDGREHRADLTDGTAHSLWEMTSLAQADNRNCFVEVEEEGFERSTYVNVSTIAMIELPATRFRQLIG
jgi:transcriptional regulator with XRE-family HTH domain